MIARYLSDISRNVTFNKYHLQSQKFGVVKESKFSTAATVYLAQQYLKLYYHLNLKVCNLYPLILLLNYLFNIVIKITG
jgi:hypothetical protein